MSRGKDLYRSQTKGRVDIQKMHPVHIKNAIKKVSTLKHYDPTMKAKLEEELKRREDK